MQEQHFNELKDDMSKTFSDLVPVESIPQVQERVRKAIDRLNEQTKLLSLPEDEYNLLVDYRTWKSETSVKGSLSVFHWKVRK